MRRSLIVILFSIFLYGCATTPAVKEGFNFSSYRKIGVIKFVSYGSINRESGASVSDEFIRQLIKSNKSVVEINNHMSDSLQSYQIVAGGYNVDGIITGTVTKYMPDGEDTVYFKNEDGNIVSEVFFKEAEIGISTKFIDGNTGEVVWSDSYIYSGFTVNDTVRSVVSVMIDRLGD